MRNTITQTLKILIASVLLSFSASYVFAFGTWSNPTAAPPGNNTDAPINTSVTHQTKKGDFSLSPGKIFTATTGNFKRLAVGSVPNVSIGNITASGRICDSVGCIGDGGTASPWTKDGAGTSISYRSGSVGFNFYPLAGSGYTTTFKMDGTGLSIGHNSSSRNLSLVTAGTKRLSISANGNVGIGTTNPTIELEVNGRARIKNGIYTKQVRATGSNPASYSIYGLVTSNQHKHNMSSANSAGVKGEASGYYGIGVVGEATGVHSVGVLGKSTHAHKGHIKDGVFFHGSIGVKGWGRQYDFYAEGPGANYAVASSRRWKNNIVNIEGALDKILRLRGVYFDWDEEHGGRHDIGMIAEEVGRVIPEAVGYEMDTENAFSLEYNSIIPVLIEATKEQQRIINLLREEIDLLKAR